MKTARNLLIVIVLAAGCSALLNYATAQQVGTDSAVNSTTDSSPRPSLAVCDVVEAFNNCEQTKAARLELQKRQQAVKAANDERVKAIDAIKMEMEGLREGSEEYNKRLEELWRLSLEREGWQKAQSAMLMRSYQLAAKRIYDEILSVVEEVAKERGLDLVLFKVQEPIDLESGEDLVAQIARRQVLYSSDALDITEIVLARLNDRQLNAARTRP